MIQQLFLKSTENLNVSHVPTYFNKHRSCVTYIQINTFCVLYAF